MSDNIVIPLDVRFDISIKMLCEVTRKSESQVENLRKELIECGWLLKYGNLYTLLSPIEKKYIKQDNERHKRLAAEKKS
ncbi:MAG: hypothetical protein A2X55_07855 [Nitrospirae bacterium GWB2_47_37]|nr:MAG: hypothetical protein A2X55_07855 [Nitrospirae bacterium GWB2_47_37]